MEAKHTPLDLDALKRSVGEFEDFLNVPARELRDEPMEVRDYRHLAYREWEPLERGILRLIEERRELLAALKIAVQLAEQIQHGGATPFGGARLIADISRAAVAKASGQ